MQFQELDDVIHVGSLLLHRSSRRLAKKRRKHKSLAYSRAPFVDIHLLTVSRRPLEADSLWTTVNQNGPVDLTAVFALGEDIEQSIFVSQAF